PDVVLGESELTFAWQAAPGTSEHFLLVAEHAFDPASWSGLPSAGDIQVVRVARPVVDWSALGRTLAAGTRVWWGAADRDPATGRIAFSAVRTTFVLPRFSNQAEQSPLMSTSPIGHEPLAPSGPRHIHL